MNIARMTDLARIYGRKDLNNLAIGTIDSIVGNDSYTPAEMVENIRETVVSLNTVRYDDSLPWKQPIQQTWSTEDILRQEA